MKSEFIELYSDGQQIGSLFFALDGGTSHARIGETGTEKCAAVVVNQMDFVFELVPRKLASGSGKNRPQYLQASLEKDELIRTKALELTHKIVEEREDNFTAISIIDLAKRIEKFLRSGE